MFGSSPTTGTRRSIATVVAFVLMASMLIGGTAFSASRHRAGGIDLKGPGRSAPVDCHRLDGVPERKLDRRIDRKFDRRMDRLERKLGHEPGRHLQRRLERVIRREMTQKVDICRTTNAKPAKGPGKDTVPPTISITSPGASESVSGTITVVGVAADDQMVRSIHVQVDDLTPRSVPPGTFWSVQIDTSRWSAGSHQILAFVRDRGLNTTYTAVDVKVALPAPPTSTDPQPVPNPGPTSVPSPTSVPAPDPTQTPAPAPLPLPGPDPIGPARGVFSVSCDLTHQAKDDPIVFPGQSGAAHIHDFFGAEGVDAFTDPMNLGNASTCDHPGDKAAYWAPAIVSPTGEVFQPTRVLAYYRATAPGPVRAVPHGLEILAGGTDPTYFGFSCSDDQNYSATPVNCPQKLVMHIVFPNCWDGVHLDSADHRSHMAYPGNGGACPSTHPIRLVQLSMHVQYPKLTNGAQGYHLAPNNDGTIPTPHADFINGWDQAVLENIVRTCLNPGLNCKLDTSIGLV